MSKVELVQLEGFLDGLLAAVGMEAKNRSDVVRVFVQNTQRQMGHHDIYDFEMHFLAVAAGKVAANPPLRQMAAFGCQERWDGGNGLGAVTCSHAMRRAVTLAQQHGMGLCAIRNSNHYISSAPYTQLAAENGCVGIIIAKAGPSMGVPGHRGNVISQSPNGYAFQTQRDWPVMLDGCLAYVSMHGNLNKAIEVGEKVPVWWGVDAEGRPTDDPEALLKGTRHPIGEHKGFGYALLCELLAGVLPGGPVLDEEHATDGLANPTSHTAIAIKADALMDMDTFKARSTTLVDRIDARAPGIRIPGAQSGEKSRQARAEGAVALDDKLVGRLNALAEAHGVQARL